VDACSIPVAGWGDEMEVMEAVRDLVVLLMSGSPEWGRTAEERLRAELAGEVTVVRHGSLADARETLLEGGFDCVLLDLPLPDGVGLETVRTVRTRAPQAPIVVMSLQASEAIALQAVREGAQEYLVKGHANRCRLARAVRCAIERRRAELELAGRATHDELTGLPNRTLFLDRLALTLGRLERRSREAAVLFLNLDGFKSVNERLGHRAGDLLLVAAAERLRSLVRPGDTVARFGGDEFVLLCDDVESPADAIGVAERLSASLSEPFALEGVDVVVGASVGIALAADGSQAAGALVRDADRAMHVAKRSGADWELYRPPRLRVASGPVPAA
jgi:two-component system cell cycle response regulator